jgi:signal transduction histidine kinase
MSKYIFQHIVKVPLSTELDVVVAYKRARQLTEMTGITLPTQTKFGTAVSEICRNVIEHVGQGAISFHLIEEAGRLWIEANIQDYGRGIADVEQYLNQKNAGINRKGSGLVNSRKLVDRFLICSNPDKGTCVQLLIKIPPKHPPINKSIVEGWQEFFAHEVDISPYEEIKRQNLQLLEVMESLRLKGIETESQLEEIKKLNEELESSNEHIRQLLGEREEKNRMLQQMNGELEQFAHTVSHDLKAPLKNITGLATLLQRSLDLSGNPKARAALEMLLGQAGKMENLITDILTYSRTGSGGVLKKSVSVAAVIEGVLGSFQVPEGFKVHLSEPLPELETEEIYLQQIFSNLIGNAVKYHDKAEGNITIEAKKEANAYTFCVADDGPGIPPSQRERIFEEFYTTGDTRSGASSGLGLSIVKRIVAQKGGQLWVESEGRGTAFCFTWPFESGERG